MYWSEAIGPGFCLWHIRIAVKHNKREVETGGAVFSAQESADIVGRGVHNRVVVPEGKRDDSGLRQISWQGGTTE